MSKDRTSNFELLKIVATIMVISLHYLNRNMGGALSNTIEGTTNYYVIHLIESLCIIAVNCFFIITGYFMAEKNKVCLGKPIKLILVSFFYGGLCYLIGVYFDIESFTIKKFISSIINFYNSKWFVWSYVIVYCLIPYINKTLISLDKSQYKILLLIEVSFFSIIPTFFPYVSYNDNGYGIISFIMLYCIGGYLKRYYKDVVNNYMYLLIYLLCSVLTCILVLSKPEINVWWRYNSILNITSTISLFIFFKNINLKLKIVNYIATYSFSVYLIHSDTVINTFLFRKIFNSNRYWNHPHLIINMIKSVFGIFLLCVIIDVFRRIVVKIFFKKLSRRFERKEIAV